MNRQIFWDRDGEPTNKYSRSGLCTPSDFRTVFAWNDHSADRCQVRFSLGHSNAPAWMNGRTNRFGPPPRVPMPVPGRQCDLSALPILWNESYRVGHLLLLWHPSIRHGFCRGDVRAMEKSQQRGSGHPGGTFFFTGIRLNFLPPTHLTKKLTRGMTVFGNGGRDSPVMDEIRNVRDTMATLGASAEPRPWPASNP